MITVRNRTLIVPEGERVIGTDYDSNSEVRQFRVEKAPGGIDISHLVFRLDLMYQGEVYDTCKLDKEEHEDCMILTWTVAAGNVSHPGTVWISLRAIDEAGTMKWGSNKAAVYVQESVNTPEHISGMSELEKYEVLIEKAVAKCDETVETTTKSIKKCTDAAQQTIEKATEINEKSEEVSQKAAEASNEATRKAKEAMDFADLSEAWAHGKEGYKEQQDDNAMYWSQRAKTEAQNAKNQADRASMYADFVTPHFIIENNRLYVRDDSTAEFAVENNRLYIKLPA